MWHRMILLKGLTIDGAQGRNRTKDVVGNHRNGTGYAYAQNGQLNPMPAAIPDWKGDIVRIGNVSSGVAGTSGPSDLQQELQVLHVLQNTGRES
jgi:hypothetical protein